VHPLLPFRLCNRSFWIENRATLRFFLNRSDPACMSVSYDTTDAIAPKTWFRYAYADTEVYTVDKRNQPLIQSNPVSRISATLISSKLCSDKMKRVQELPDGRCQSLCCLRFTPRLMHNSRIPSNSNKSMRTAKAAFWISDIGKTWQLRLTVIQQSHFARISGPAPKPKFFYTDDTLSGGS